jgi:hypothetical protein
MTTLDCLVEVWLTPVPHTAIPVPTTMTFRSISDPSSIFEDGRLKGGIYKIQNIQTENFLDIEVHTRKICCRPARDLGEGRGFVRRYLPSPIRG